MQMSKKEYANLVKKHTPPTRQFKTLSMAFLIGGTICLIGEWIMEILQKSGLDKESSSAWTSIILVFSSALLTGLGLYERIAKTAGAGTLVPITGFANGISSSAIEAQSEGFILGVGTKIFQIAGPVILYGSAASVVYGIIYYLISMF